MRKSSFLLYPLFHILYLYAVLEGVIFCSGNFLRMFSELVFYIKRMNDWTEKLYRAVDEGRITGNTKIWMYGVSGSPSVDYERYQNILLFAGGVGVTPMAPIYMSLLRNNENANSKQVFFLKLSFKLRNFRKK
jgi:predicted ferric reductase